MFRVFFLTFYGTFRGTHDQAHHLHESPPVMTTPLIILAILSTLGGFLGMPAVFGSTNKIEHFLHESVSFPVAWSQQEPTHTFEWILMLTSVIILAIIIILTYRRFATQQILVSDNEGEQSTPVKLAYRKFYVDELYNSVITKPLNALSGFFYKSIDTKLIDGFVNSIGKGITSGSSFLRLAQTGYVGFYIFAMVFGLIAILLYNLVIK